MSWHTHIPAPVSVMWDVALGAGLILGVPLPPTYTASLETFPKPPHLVPVTPPSGLTTQAA